MNNKEHIMTISDFKVQTFKSGGKGGQHQNKTESGVRIIHERSGAIGESRNHRSQDANKKEAFKRLSNSMVFKKWLNAEIAVNNMMKEENITTQIFDKSSNEWIEIDPKYLTD